MKRNENLNVFVAGALLVLFILFLSGCESAPKEKIYRVGILSGLDIFSSTTDGFKEQMIALGYVEGENIIYDIQNSSVEIDAYRNILHKFVNQKVDLIFVFPTEAAMEAKIITNGTGIPVVFANAFIEDTGLVDSVRQPGGDITGVRWDGPDMALQRFEIMHELVPNAKNVWIPHLKGYPIVRSQLEALRPAFNSTGLTMVEIPAENATELKDAFEKQVQLTGPPDAILFLAEPLHTIPESFIFISKFAGENNIPVGGTYMLIGEYESLFGNVPQPAPQGRQAAILTDKILKGTPAGTIPVVTTDNYFQISYRQAQRLGLSISESLLARADKVIK